MLIAMTRSMARPGFLRLEASPGAISTFLNWVSESYYLLVVLRVYGGESWSILLMNGLDRDISLCHKDKPSYSIVIGTTLFPLIAPIYIVTAIPTPYEA